MPVCLRAALIGILASVLLAPAVFTQSSTPKAAPVVGTTPTPPAPPTGAPPGSVEFTAFGTAVTPVGMKARGDATSRTGPDKD